MDKLIQLLKRVRLIAPNAELNVVVFDVFMRVEIRFDLGKGAARRKFSFSETELISTWGNWIDSGQVDAVVAPMERNIAFSVECFNQGGAHG